MTYLFKWLRCRLLHTSDYSETITTESETGLQTTWRVKHECGQCGLPKW